MPTYILDGHNLLYAARQSFLAHLEDGHPGAAAREELARRLAGAFTAPGQAVFLYFDGSEARTETRSAQLQVIYSGGEGDQRADKAILSQVSRQVTAGDVATVVVVTLDIKLARRSRKRGASVMAPGEFLAMFELQEPGSEPEL